MHFNSMLLNCNYCGISKATKLIPPSTIVFKTVPTLKTIETTDFFIPSLIFYYYVINKTGIALSHFYHTQMLHMRRLNIRNVTRLPNLKQGGH
jgi:hypothetical protein